MLPLRGAEDPAFVDWYGGSLSLAVQRALQLGNGSLDDAPHSGVPAVGSIFWRAVLRGGTQGGVYLLDSVRIAARQGTVKELLASL